MSADGGWHSVAPAAPLDRFIDRLWTAARPAGLQHAREWNLPTGRAELVVPLNQPALRRFAAPGDTVGIWLAGGLLQGAMLRPTLRDTAGASIVVGAQFKPGGLPGLLAMPADALTGQTVALDTLWPGWADGLRDRVHTACALHDAPARLRCLEHALRARWHLASPADAMVGWALAGLARGEAIGHLQCVAGVSPTTFIRRFSAACGLTPVQHRQLQRLQRALAAAHAGAAWVEVAHASGYADQPHLVREMRRLTLHTPTQWRAAATGAASHLVCA